MILINRKTKDCYDLIDIGSDVILEDREKNGLPSDGVYKVAFIALLSYVFYDLKLLSLSEYQKVEAKFVSYYKKQINYDISDIFLEYKQKFASARVRATEKTVFLTSCLFIIEYEVCGGDPDDSEYMDKSCLVFMNSLSYILKLFQN